MWRNGRIKIHDEKYTVIIWGIGDTYNRLYNVIKFEEIKGNIDIKGLTSLETYVSCKDEYKVLCSEEVLKLQGENVARQSSSVISI